MGCLVWSGLVWFGLAVFSSKGGVVTRSVSVWLFVRFVLYAVYSIQYSFYLVFALLILT